MAQASTSTKPGETTEENGPGRNRSWLISAFIVAYLFFQVSVPLTYYAGFRDDLYDERFAWRMFSTVRLYSCSTTSSEVISMGGSEITRPIDLPRTVHMVWVSNIQRNRSRVIRSFLQQRCTQPNVRSVRLVNMCRKTDGTDLLPHEYELECQRS